MPLYEYQCGCGRRYEELQDSNAQNTMSCDCGGLAKRVLSVSSVKTSKKSPDKPLGPSLGYSELICGE